MQTPPASPWWTPEVHADRRPFLLVRNRIKARLRDWFGKQDFVEVEAAALQVSPGNEAHLHAFATEAIGPDGALKGRVFLDRALGASYTPVTLDHAGRVYALNAGHMYVVGAN